MLCWFLRLAELVIPQDPDGKVHMDLITQHGIQPLDIHICKNPDGTDWLLGLGGYGKVKLECKHQFLIEYRKTNVAATAHFVRA